ncbi:PAS domain S-box-containing protein [Duganella sp. CF402]|uniref:hybrid sensor histidine kinase/response regulator n=1 Tax=unclassified Duganella TaxID=2636909 RepID=UPI0008C2D962|nr:MULTISPECIES: ATP-binding protein [unclassified Duganella]RZT10982.1 PAS domain S-box-containing protein [Duganella sp. BK701]SEK87016.1 PAS domain S-box-containing protein [Duganella sp. CF402]
MMPNAPITSPSVAQDAHEELLRAREALQQSQLELRALANSMPQLAWIAEQDGAMVWYNQRWYDYTGTTPEQMAGDGWQAVYAPDCLDAMSAHWDSSRRSGTPFELEVPIRSADGEFRWFLMRANPVHGSDGNVLRWFGTSTDVDQVKRVQEALRDETAVLELLNRTGAMLASQRDLQPLLQEVTDAATSIAGARFGAFFYHSTNSAGETLVLHTLSTGAPAAFSQFGQPRATALFGPSLRGEGIIRCDDVLQDPRYGNNPPHAGIPAGHPPVRSYLAVPVALGNGDVIGSLFFGHPQPGMFSERTERIIAGIAAQAAVAIDNARLYEAARQAAEERKVLLDSERQARAEAERTNQLKDEFLATLSHELRTPLTAILGWAQVLRRGSRDAADLQRGLQTIERNARAQAQLIEDLLDMSSITSGKVRLEMQPLAPDALAAAAIESVRPAADAKQIHIDKDFQHTPGMVSGDANRLQQILWNLLSNAIKFTPRGGAVTVGVRSDGDQIAITVRDSGIGIAPGFLQHVFERFRQADATTTRQHGGLGLGLAIVKHLVEQHGGTIAVTSEGEGRGACFTLRLPAHHHLPAPAAPPAPAKPHAAVQDLSGVQVLVVDDEDDARELIKRILSDCNAEVLTAATAAEALQLLQHERPDLLVSDLGMPGMDGYGLLDRIRALGPSRGGDLPAIALTAFAHAEDRGRALASGFLAHLAKPVEPDELIAKVAATHATQRDV